MDSLTLQPFAKPFDVTLAPPGSKSLTNRALVLSALADGDCTLTNVLFADDTRVMLANLAALGFTLTVDEPARTVRVAGEGGRVPAAAAELFCGNSGTTIRFLTALCALGRGTYTLDGIPRMRQRPIGPLVALLRNLGAPVDHADQDGFPPVRVRGHGLAGGLVQFGAEQSSQYLSAVLQVAPCARNEVHVDLAPNQTSWPYIQMTMRLMDEFGVTPELLRHDDLNSPHYGQPKQIVVPRHAYQPTEYAVEPDASNATYFLAAAAVREEARVTIRGLGTASLQGDVGFADVLKQMGAAVETSANAITVAGTGKLRGIEVDLAGMPDVAQTLAVVALFAKGETTIRGLHTLRVKETDRIAALSAELRKLGAAVEVAGDDLTIRPPTQPTPASIDTYDDHRMAMSFAVAGTRAAGVTINDPACVDKTYPEFFRDLETLRVR